MSQRKWILYWVISGLLIIITLYFPLKKPVREAAQQKSSQPETVAPPAPHPSTKSPDSATRSKTDKTEVKHADSVTAASPEEVKKIRTEIKVGLAGLYTAEKAYQAEYGRYTTDLTVIGWEPMEAKSNIKVGFVMAFNPKQLTERESPRSMDSEILRDEIQSQGRTPFEVTARAKDIDLERYESYCQRGCTADETHFEIMASTHLGYGKPEIWILNENKEIKQLNDGTR